MATQLMLEKWPGQVSTVTIGATKEEGGTRANMVKIGGEAALPFLFEEGALPNKPCVAFEIEDVSADPHPEEIKWNRNEMT